MTLDHHLAVADDDLAGLRVGDVSDRRTAENLLAQRYLDVTALDEGAFGQTLGRATVVFDDHGVLRHVHQTAGQVARVGRFERRVGQALAGTVGRVEVLERCQTFLEVGNNRRLDDCPVRLGQQPAHGRRLTHLGNRTPRARVRHHVDRVHVPALLAGNALHHGFGHALGALRPDVDDLVVLLTRGDQTILVLLLEVLDLLLSLTDDVPLVVRDHQVVLAEGNAGRGRVLETQRHQRIGEQHRILLPGRPVDGVDQLGGFLLGQHLVDGVKGNRHRAGQHVGQQNPARRCFTHAQHRLAVLIEVRNPCPHLGVHGNRFGSQCVADFLGRTEDRTRPDFVFLALDREVVDPQDDILTRNDDRLAVGRGEDVVGRHHQAACFKLSFQRQRHVHGHLVAVEVSVEGGTDQRVQVDGLALDQHGFEGLDAQTVQGRRPVQHDRVLADHLFEDIPDLGALLFHHALGGLDGRRQPIELELGVDKRLEQLQRHLLRNTALVQLQRRTHHDHGTTRVIHALAEQVLTEPALLTLEHVGERLERALVGAGNDPATTAVIEQGVDRFLQHPLLVADDDVRRAQFDQPLQAVVPVDHAAVEVVEIRGREPATVQRHQRAQLRWNDRQHVEHHPFGLGA